VSDLLNDPNALSDKQEDPQHDNQTAFTIRRKGSRYNILGPNGREFTNYKSASVVGPRWEELTHTPWPYSSSAYESGTRLWQLGVIERSQVGQRELAPPPKPQRAAKPKAKKPAAKKPARTTKASETPAPKKTAKPVRQPAKIDAPAAKPAKPVSQPDPPARQQEQARPVLARPGQTRTITLTVFEPMFALPAPRIDLSEQTRLIQALRSDPRLIFQPNVREALQQEVEYHRPYAAWASTLLRLLTRFEKRERLRARLDNDRSSDVIQRKHIAWQEQQLARTSASQ